MLDEREAEVPAAELDRSFNRKPVGQRIAIVAAGPIANFLLALLFFWILAMLGTQQVRPVVGSVAADSIAAQAGLQVGQEILSVDGKAVTGWGGVNLQLVRRLGERRPQPGGAQPGLDCRDPAAPAAQRLAERR